jgi:Zn-dependent protease
MGRTLRLFSIAGIPIAVHASWLLAYAIITWSLALGYFRYALPELPAVAHWLNGLLAALLLFVSVLLHELSHSFMARHYGLTVGGITLHVFGGVSQLTDEPPSPRAEFWIAAVGPLSSLALAAVLAAVRFSAVTEAPWADAVLAYLVFVNVAVGIFNLLPGFPLDGGRLLRAALWKRYGGLRRATVTASRVGAGVAAVLVGLGVFQLLGGSLLGGVWFIMIGLFLRGSADASAQEVTLRAALGALPVSQVMSRNVVVAPADSTVAELVEQFWAHHYTSFPVVENGVVVGIASLQQLRDTPPERWSSTRVRDVMRALTPDLIVAPQTTAFEALQKTARNEVGRVAVVDGSRVVGYLSMKDLTHVIALKGLDGDVALAEMTPPRDLRRAA